jgi:hypothetical protein
MDRTLLWTGRCYGQDAAMDDFGWQRLLKALFAFMSFQTPPPPSLSSPNTLLTYIQRVFYLSGATQADLAVVCVYELSAPNTLPTWSAASPCFHKNTESLAVY